jgi:hypothetical protein
MRQQRGTFDSTLYNYGLAIRDLLKALGEDPSVSAHVKVKKFKHRPVGGEVREAAPLGY